MDLFRRLYGRQVNAGGAVDRVWRRRDLSSTAWRQRTDVRSSVRAREVLSAVGRVRRSSRWALPGLADGARRAARPAGGGDVDIVGGGNRHRAGAATRCAPSAGNAHAHEPFLTAVVRLHSGLRSGCGDRPVRSSTARRPRARGRDLGDSARTSTARTSTVNAMAIDLRRSASVELFDFFGAADLDAKAGSGAPLAVVPRDPDKGDPGSEIRGASWF